MIPNPASIERIAAAWKQHWATVLFVALSCLGFGTFVGSQYEALTNSRNIKLAAIVASLEGRNTELETQLRAVKDRSDQEASQLQTSVDELNERLQLAKTQHEQDAAQIVRLTAVEAERDKLRVENEALKREALASTSDAAKPMDEAAKHFAPGWIVRLRTAALKDGQFEYDPGFIAMYRQDGPEFNEATFVQNARLAGATVPVFALASAIFVAGKAGTYQLGIRMEPSGSICGFTMMLNGTIIKQGHTNDNGPIVIFADPIELRKRYNDVQIALGCFNHWNGKDYLEQSEKGRIIVLVQHPGDLSVAPAQPGDFVSPP